MDIPYWLFPNGRRLLSREAPREIGMVPVGSSGGQI